MPSRERDARPDTSGRLPSRLVQRAQHAYANRLGPTQRSLLVSWASFATTFGLVRFITHGIRGGWLPVGNISGGGRHLHHYNIGIAILATVGGIAVHGKPPASRHPLTAAAYGAGNALIADEFALLLDLQDVYWAKEGRVSVDVAVGTIALTGLYFVGMPFWHALGDEVTRRP